MKAAGFLLFVSSIFLLTACFVDEDPASDFRIFSYQFDFNESDHDWKAGFADFPANQDTSLYRLQFKYTDQTPGAEHRRSIMLSGNNHSDDLFMYIKRKITDLEPDAEYTLTFQVEFTSNAQRGLAGIGGAPGESVYVKVGAVGNEPKAVVEGNHYRMNIDKGNQAQGGENMVNLGDIAVDENANGYVVKNLSNGPYSSTYNGPITARTNAEGELWLIVGTDSGFEGKTTIYYTNVSIVFSRNQ
jgi:hypothetical protein